MIGRLLGRFVGFLKELRRRKVYRVAAGYLAASFVVVEAADLTFTRMGLRPWTVTLVIVVLGLGFPIALVLAWALQVTPAGVRMEKSADGSLARGETPPPAKPRPVSRTREEKSPEDDEDRGEVEKSVAVLPFADMSPDRDHEYFGEGLAEEVLNALTQLENLQVAARTSSFAYRRQETSVREIGRDLGVATVVEGSVRRHGDRLRVTAQLVETDSGYHLWSETYDRTFDDVFAIQEEITASIVEALHVELLGEEADRLSRVGTENPDAYDLYLKGRHYWKRRHKVGLETALECFDEALEEDPRFALAHAGIADVYFALGCYGMEDPEIVRRRAQGASRRAVELGPGLPDSHSARGNVLVNIDYDFGAGIKALERALELDASHARTEAWRSLYLAAWRGGDRKEAERALQRAIALEPESIYIRSAASLAYLIFGKSDEAAREADEVLRMEPEATISLYTRGLVHSDQGEHEAAIEKLQRAVAVAHRATFALALLGAVQGRAGDREAAVGILNELYARRDDGTYVAPQFFAMVEAHLERTEEALDHLETHVKDRHPGIGPFLPSGVFDILRGEPRYEELLKSVDMR